MQVYKFIVPEVIFGSGALSEVGEATRRLGTTRALVVCDPSVAAVGWLAKMLPYLREQNLSYVVWSGFTSNPKDGSMERSSFSVMSLGACGCVSS